MRRRKRTLTTIDLSVSAPRGIEYTAAPSLFINYALHGDTMDATSPIAAGRASAFAEAGLSVGGALLYTALDAPSTTTIVRGLSNASYDLPDKLLRIVRR